MKFQFFMAKAKFFTFYFSSTTWK